MTRARFLFWLDLLLLLSAALLQSPRVTSLIGHEWLGIGFSVAVALHLLVNWKWIVNTLRRMVVPGARRPRVNAALNATLFFMMTLTVFTGLAVSEVVVPLTGLQPSALRVWRPMHSVFAGVSVALIGLHVALNWDWISGVIRRRLILGNPAPGAAEALDVHDPGDLEDAAPQAGTGAR